MMTSKRGQRGSRWGGVAAKKLPREGHEASARERSGGTNIGRPAFKESQGPRTKRLTVAMLMPGSNRPIILTLMVHRRRMKRCRRPSSKGGGNMARGEGGDAAVQERNSEQKELAT
ncbi:hypothetical protein AMTR_s00006p00263420 [Amborella trichopoda]|uniref:Uncharacterized protein n=1 Tax=Amborella trichopoda TaxID=13333 RepID=W1P7J7_AMBTC|nr:hypothetical protein AMTR_s00006p00263420 [Amborella trichopoda]